MKEQLKMKAVATKNFVQKHRVGIAVTLTSVAWASLMVHSAKGLNDFLKEHDLLEEYYYQPETEEEALELKA